MSVPSKHVREPSQHIERRARAYCRSCLSEPLKYVVSLGKPSQDLAGLRLCFCPRCVLAQLPPAAPAAAPSREAAAPPEAGTFAERLIRSRRLGPDSMVVEVVDQGSTLNAFVAAGIPALAIDTGGESSGGAATGIPTIKAAFDVALARMLREAFSISAELFLAPNVLAGAPDPNGFAGGIRALLRPDGIAIVEVPYLLTLIDRCQIDAISPHRYCYFSATALDRLFARNGLFVNDAEVVPGNPDALRVMVEPHDDRRERVAHLLDSERERGVTELGFYEAFAQRVSGARRCLRATLSDLRRQGRRIAGYGRASRAASLCANVGLDDDVLDYFVVHEGAETARHLAGTRVPIVTGDHLQTQPPDYLLALDTDPNPRPVCDEAAFRAAGGRFIAAFPELTIT